VAEKTVADTSGETCETKTFTSEAMEHAVELARQELRERGYTDEQIDLLLNRRRAPDDLTRG